MPTFAYSARDAAGQTVSAALDAPTRRDALRLITSRGLTPVNLSEQTAATKNAVAKPGSSKLAAAVAVKKEKGVRPVRITRGQRLPFLTALHELTSGGLSAGEAVRLLAARVKEPALRALSAGLWERISEGATISRALAAYPDVFDTNTINLVASGEATGNLTEVLIRIIDHLTEQRDMQRQLMQALAYPIFLTVVATGVVLFFLFFLLPRLKTLFDALHGELPFATRFLIGLSGFALHWGILVVIVLAFAAVSLWKWRNSADGRRITDGWLLQLPVAGQFFVARTVLTFSQTLSVLLENGITTAEALRMTERQVDNTIHREAFSVATDRVLEGEALAKALARTGCFPDLVLDQLAVGENTGNLVPSLRRIAVNHQKMISAQLKFFTSVVGSAVLCTVFLFVGFIAFAIVSAVFKLSETIHG
jgi:type II secretory pathway component PulF